MHWIGAQFCVCMFLDSIDKSLNRLNFVGTIKENERTKKNKGSVLVAESAYNAQNAHFGLVMMFNLKDIPIHCEYSFVQYQT